MWLFAQIQTSSKLPSDENLAGDVTDSRTDLEIEGIGRL